MSDRNPGHAPGPEDRTTERLSALAEEWDSRYASAPRVFRAEPDESLVELASPLEPGRALDLGAGEGRNALWLASKGWAVVAVDLSEVALGRLRGFADAAGLQIETVRGDGVAYLRSAGPASFALAVLAYVHSGPQEHAALFAAAGQALSPGGHLFIVGHHISSLGRVGPPDPERLYREEEITTALAGLEILRIGQRRGESDVHEHGTDLVVWARRPPSAEIGNG